VAAPSEQLLSTKRTLVISYALTNYTDFAYSGQFVNRVAILVLADCVSWFGRCGIYIVRTFFGGAESRCQ
jgi:hypothetical protein